MSEICTPLMRAELEVLRSECWRRASNGKGRDFWLEAARKIEARLASLGHAASTEGDAKGETQL